MPQSFREVHSLDKRKAEASRILAKYPDRVPVVIEKDFKCNMDDIDKNKYLVPGDLTMGQMIHVVRRRLKIGSEKAIFLFINGRVLPPSAALICNVYGEHVEEDGFLYLTYSSENCFGYKI